MRTKEEILIEHRNYIENDNDELYSDYELLKAMQEYAEEYHQDQIQKIMEEEARLFDEKKK